MEEDPKDHDFDQRHDGPLGRVSVQIAPDDARQAAGENISVEDRAMTRGKSLPDARTPQSPTSATAPTGSGFAPRRSMQMSRTKDEKPPRRSTQISSSGQHRPSVDFDVRRDGPFGRPSITMTRRQSSGQASPTGGVERRDTQAIIAALEEEGKTEQAASGSGSDQQPPSIETLQSTDAAFEPEPPPLNYTLMTRKLSIAIFWGLIVFDSTIMPIALYFGLWYGTDLSPNTVFSIVTAALGGISILEYVLRFRRLWMKGSTCRVIGARRSYLDWFHWNFSVGWVIIMVELIVGTIPTHPPIRLLAMPLASMCYAFGTELLIVDICRYFQVPAPCRISSVPKGAQLRPGIYSIIEDVCAVDGSGGTEFRENLNRRYEASHTFRAMLRRLGVFWAVGGEGIAVVTTIIVFTVEHNAAYVVGWTLPFVWAGIWVPVTMWYVKRKLKQEKTAWAEEVAAKSNA